MDKSDPATERLINIGVGAVLNHPSNCISISHDALRIALPAIIAAMPDERALIVAWLREDAKQCDCFAHEEGECTCGAWWDNKESNVLTLADAIEAGEHMR